MFLDEVVISKPLKTKINSFSSIVCQILKNNVRCIQLHGPCALNMTRANSGIGPTNFCITKRDTSNLSRNKKYLQQMTYWKKTYWQRITCPVASFPVNDLYGFVQTSISISIIKQHIWSQNFLVTVCVKIFEAASMICIED